MIAESGYMSVNLNIGSSFGPASLLFMAVVSNVSPAILASNDKSLSNFCVVSA